MNQISQYRSAWRKARREEELAYFKQNIRNLIYYHQSQQNSSVQCPLCLDDRWLYAQDVRHVTRLLLSVFHQRHICNAHIETFISKTLESLQMDPSIYRRLMSCEGRQRREIVYRKIVLLLEIFDNQILLENEQLWEQIKGSFTQRSEFMLKLMDCAYSYNEWPAQDCDENWDIEVKSICYTSVLNLFAKFPLLFHNYLQEYPISALLEKSKGAKCIELLSLLKSIISYSEEKAQLEPTVYFLFVGFKTHLFDIKQLEFSLQIFIAQLQLFRTFALQWNFMDKECICYIICLINTNISVKSHTYELIFATLKPVKEKYYYLFDQQLLYEADSLLCAMSATAQQKETKCSIEESSNMEVQPQQ